MIDEFPVFSVAAAYATGLTRVSDAIELRQKESDRIKALCQEMTKLEVDIDETPDGFEIQGGKTPSANVVYSHGDHRLAMSLAIAGLAAQSTVSIEDAEIIGESFPNFVPVLQGLGANIELGSAIDEQ
jgi:3-phosphoshikimate 1-carboxyvinyltransferase